MEADRDGDAMKTATYRIYYTDVSNPSRVLVKFTTSEIIKKFYENNLHTMSIDVINKEL